MDKLTKVLLHTIILVKVLFIISLIRFYFVGFTTYDASIKNGIQHRKDILHEGFIFLMYVIILILFNPRQNNIALSNDQTESYHLQIAVFSLAAIQIINFDYSHILSAPRELYLSISG